MRTQVTLALTGLLIFAGCGGGGSTGGLPPGPGGSGGGTQAQSESAISTTNAFGSPLRSLTSYNGAISPQSVGRQTQSLPLGTCTNGIEFFAPDKNGDPNSTESQYFYDSACSSLARDVVRLYTSTGSSSETVNRTVSIYASGSGTASAVRKDADTLTNATFGQYGFPVAASGFDLVINGTLSLSGVKNINADMELVMAPASGAVNGFCSDSAGFNATGIPALNETFGWQGAVLNGGTRTANSDGSVTWAATHAGNTFKGSIGGLSINTGTQNTACPIATPMFTLTGGTQVGSYSIPVVATYKNGLLTNLAVTNATMANGTTLNVTTNTNVQPQNSLFINGIISNAGAQVATFNTDAFGDGTLTLTSSGAQFVITDWHVIK